MAGGQAHRGVSNALGIPMHTTVRAANETVVGSQTKAKAAFTSTRVYSLELTEGSWR